MTKLYQKNRLKTLNELLKDNQEYELLNGIDVDRNHVSMTLIALYGLGAEPEQMKTYYSSKEKNLSDSIKKDIIDINDENWQQFLSAPESRSYIRFFIDKIDTKSVDSMLRTYLPKLISGLAAHAYHPLIRLAYGIDIKNDKEVAFAMAYFASTYHQGPTAVIDGMPRNLSETLNKLTCDESLKKVVLTGSNIIERIGQIFSNKAFLDILEPLKLDEIDPMKTVSGVMLKTFEKIHHFTLLHGITSCHAMRIILPFLSDQKKAVTEYSYSLFAAYLTVLLMKKEANNKPLPQNNTEEGVLKTKAISSMNEHTIKLTYTCFKEYEIYKRPEYLQLISREILTPAPFY